MIIVGSICAYLLGAIPFAYIFTKAIKGVDIREEGSGNVGATNALRVVGGKIAFLILVLDVLKGALAAGILASFFSKYTQFGQLEVRLIFSAAVVAGHIWPVFLKFRGGKGVATMLGVLIGLSFYLPQFRFLLSVSLVTWMIFFIATRYVSVGSILAALSLPVAASLKGFDLRIVLTCIFLGGLIAFKHHINIKRLITKKETKISFRKSS